MDKASNIGLQSLTQSVFMRAVLLSSIGLGLTACTDSSLNRYGQNDNSWQNLPSKHAAPYFSNRQAGGAYVLMAQNNSIPQLRGPSHLRSTLLQQYHFGDSPKNYAISPSSVEPSNISQAYTSNLVVASDPRQHFEHQLEDAAPRRLSYHGFSKPKIQSASVPYVAQHAPGFQESASQVYTSPTATPQVPSDAETNFQPEFSVSATSFTESMNIALKQSPRLAIEDIKIQEAEEQLEQAKSQGRFKLNFEGVVGASQNETDFRVVNRTDSDFRTPRTANLNLSLPLYQGGLLSAQKDVAKVGIKTAKANYLAVEGIVTEQAGVSHLNVLRDRSLVEVYQRNVVLLKNQQNTVQALLRAGENTVTDEALVEARLASIQSRLKQAQSNQSASESRYKKLTGYAAPSLSPIQEIRLPSSLQEAKDVALSNNAELQAMQSQSEAAYHNIALAKSHNRPKLALQGGLRASEGQSDTVRRSSAAELLLNLSVPILSGGENKSRVRQAVLAQSRTALETRALQDELNEHIEQLWATVSAAKQSKIPNLTQKIAAEKAYKAIVLQRKAGVVTSLDVLSIEQTLLDAELNIIQADNAERVARLQILGLMGALSR